MQMKGLLYTTATLALCASAAGAAGIERSRLPYAALFEQGRYVELGFSHVTPSVSGEYTGPFPGLGGSATTGNMAESYTALTFAYKADINDKLAYAVFINTPYGADALYQQGFYTGLEAHWSSTQIATVVKYKATDRISVYGGLRYVESKANIIIPPSLLGGFTYTADGEKDGRFGYTIGAAYEIPDIALRVGLTYENAITHKFDTAESFGAPPVTTTTSVTMPQSLTLDFQSGVAKDTLVFGSIKWAEWSVWEVRPPIYDGVMSDSITEFDNDVITYQLGVGRKLNDNLSVFARVGHEKANGGSASRLSPTDGQTSFGIGGTWRQDKMKITAGIEYAKLGDATTGAPTLTEFSNNSAVGFGLSVGYNF